MSDLSRITISVPCLAVSYSKAAEITNLAESHIREAVKSGDLPVCRVGNRTSIPITALELWLESLVQRPAR